MHNSLSAMVLKLHETNFIEILALIVCIIFLGNKLANSSTINFKDPQFHSVHNYACKEHVKSTHGGFSPDFQVHNFDADVPANNLWI